MPFKPSAELTTPDDATVVWRYMDFAKFVDLIANQTLWFARADQFEDPLEGTFTDAELSSLKTFFQVPSNHSVGDGYLALQKWNRITKFVNCWRMSDKESLAMWDLYGKGSGVVAAKSTVGLLKNEFSASDWNIFIGQVRYLDWNIISENSDELLYCTRKDDSYLHESEVRSIISFSKPPLSNCEYLDDECLMNIKANSMPGIAIKIKVRQLITEIIVGPRERPWVVELVKKILNKYELQIPVKPSNKLMPR
jgi:hypothetical protein